MATFNRKGLTPIISVILLLMMVIAVAGGMFFWVTRIQGQQQGGIESYQGKFFTTAATQASVIKATYNDSNQSLSIFVQNTGNNPIPVPTTSTYPTTEWIVSDSNQKAICSTSWAGSAAISGATNCTRGCGTDISIGQIRQINLALSSSECSLVSQPNGSKISFLIDFSGKTTASGSFDK